MSDEVRDQISDNAELARLAGVTTGMTAIETKSRIWKYLHPCRFQQRCWYGKRCKFGH